MRGTPHRLSRLRGKKMLNHSLHQSPRVVSRHALAHSLRHASRHLARLFTRHRVYHDGRPSRGRAEVHGASSFRQSLEVLGAEKSVTLRVAASGPLIFLLLHHLQVRIQRVQEVPHQRHSQRRAGRGHHVRQRVPHGRRRSRRVVVIVARILPTRCQRPRARGQPRGGLRRPAPTERLGPRGARRVCLALSPADASARFHVRVEQPSHSRPPHAGSAGLQHQPPQDVPHLGVLVGE
mmetsp:Transcript_12626/g.54218  ORF Transcript_12626/g.54218 Transcript_12626/m.54218 type:complete len:236 (-) Transcript_12626:307-1014(-)